MNGNIDASDIPKSIFDANKKDVLKGFELGQFRTQYNKMKGELGINVRGGVKSGNDDDGKFPCAKYVTHQPNV